MPLQKKESAIDKFAIYLIILQFLIIYFVNNAPDFILLTNLNAIIVGLFFLVNNILHYKNRMAAIYIIPFVSFASFLMTDGFLKYYGAIVCFTSMLINWGFFDYFLNNNKKMKDGILFYKNNYFWSAAVGSNFMCAAIDSIDFSLAVEAQKPLFNELGVIISLVVLFSFFAIMLRNDEKLLRIFSILFGISLFVSVWQAMTAPWVDPFAYKLSSILCGCNPDDQLAWIVDISSTSLFKVIIPTFCWWGITLFKKSEHKKGAIYG
jgi:hypothetical protein